MKSPFVSELKPDQTINCPFLVQLKDIRLKKSGDPYLSLTLADRTGELDAKMWDNAAEVIDTFDRDDFIKVKGLVQVFQNRLQLTIHKLQRLDDSDVAFADYFPASKRDPMEMEAELRAVVAGIGNSHLKALLEAVFGDEKLMAAYRMAPAAKSIHHAYLSGLIEHVLSMVALAKFTAAHYAGVDSDLVLTGVLLHDIGKIHELVYVRTFGYSDEGQLIGHIVMGVKMVNEKARAIPGFPPRLLTLVEHLILSHHGTLEYGSPKVPLFPEAMLLHHLDNLDSKMEAMRQTIERDQRIEGSWTGYNPALERAVLKRVKYLDDSPKPVVAPPVTRPPAPPPPAAAPSGNSLLADKLTSALQKSGT
ncbi:MAG TPA: HD domain-containing protein [Bryobacteraceae bacterium]